MIAALSISRTPSETLRRARAAQGGGQSSSPRVVLRALPKCPESEHDRRGPGIADGLPTMSDLTRLLQQASAGASAEGLPIAALYDEVRRLARSFMRSERSDHTLQPTALANEAWLRLFGTTTPTFDTGGAFLAAAVTTLRRILVEHGRRRGRKKRGGDRQRAEVDADQLPSPQADDRILALDEALQRLEAFDPGKSRLVELRFFGGLSVDEAAAVLGLSPRTAARDWRVARAFLQAELGAEAVDDDLDA
jgi:RNA polymerase sigma factor (TIGR02999 family)